MTRMTYIRYVVVDGADKNVTNEEYFLSIWDLYEFSRGFTAERAKNWSAAAKIVNFFYWMQRYFSDILRCVAVCNTNWKLLMAF